MVVLFNSYVRSISDAEILETYKWISNYFEHMKPSVNDKEQEILPLEYCIETLHPSCSIAYEHYLSLNSKRQKENLPLIAATYAIDLYWHAHMMHPQVYIKDCMTLFGALLDHETVMQHDEQAELYAQQVWQQAYNSNIFECHLRRSAYDWFFNKK